LPDKRPGANVTTIHVFGERKQSNEGSRAHFSPIGRLIRPQKAAVSAKKSR